MPKMFAMIPCDCDEENTKSRTAVKKITEDT